MAKDFKAETAVGVVKKNSNVEKSPHSNQGKLYREYYSLDTGDPITLSKLTQRVKKRFSDIDRSSTNAMLDLYFLHSNLEYYKIEKPFTKYLKEDLEISKTHAYGVIHAVGLLNDYYSSMGSKAPPMERFINEIATSLEDVGIKKLIIVSAIKDEEAKFKYVDRLISGEDISASAILKDSKPKQDSSKSVEVEVAGNEIKIDGKPVAKILVEDDGLVSAVANAISRFYRK